MNGFVYMWIYDGPDKEFFGYNCKDKIYIGSHKSTYGPTNDSYVGGGTVFNEVYKETTKQYWFRVVLYIGQYFAYVENQLLRSLNAYTNDRLLNVNTSKHPSLCKNTHKSEPTGDEKIYLDNHVLMILHNIKNRSNDSWKEASCPPARPFAGYESFFLSHKYTH